MQLLKLIVKYSIGIYTTRQRTDINNEQSGQVTHDKAEYTWRSSVSRFGRTTLISRIQWSGICLLKLCFATGAWSINEHWCLKLCTGKKLSNKCTEIWTCGIGYIQRV